MTYNRGFVEEQVIHKSEFYFNHFKRILAGKSLENGRLLNWIHKQLEDYQDDQAAAKAFIQERKDELNKSLARKKLLEVDTRVSAINVKEDQSKSMMLVIHEFRQNETK
ncbi:hypothetical protein ACJRO7_012990 [Eucalyptus globulus]|uniref:Uncharacterized protein n=1 Tax=Eucalyptus globulus TaxID=34317 RepID=A0ABD3LKE5_EUCGL